MQYAPSTMKHILHIGEHKMRSHTMIILRQMRSMYASTRVMMICDLRRWEPKPVTRMVRPTAALATSMITAKPPAYSSTKGAYTRGRQIEPRRSIWTCMSAFKSQARVQSMRGTSGGLTRGTEVNRRTASRSACTSALTGSRACADAAPSP